MEIEMDRDEIIKLASQAIDDTRSAVSRPIPFVMRFAVLVAAAERAKLERQEPVGYIIFPKHRKAPDVRWADNTKIMEGAAIYAAPPVTAPAVGYVNALRYIAWEAAGYMDCVHAAKRAIGEMGALPPPPKTQPPEAG